MALPATPWLRPPDAGAAEVIAGFRAGSAIAMERAKLAQQAEEAQAELNLKAQMAQRAHEREQAQLAFQSQYREQQNAIAEGKLRTAQEAVALRTQDAARKFQLQQRMDARRQELIASGMDAAQAGLRAAVENPEAFSSPAGLAPVARELHEMTHPFMPEKLTVGGVPVMRTGPNRVQVLKEQTATAKLTPEQQANAQILKSRIIGLERELRDPKNEDEKVQGQLVADLNVSREQLKKLYGEVGQAGPTSPGGPSRLRWTPQGIVPVETTSAEPVTEPDEEEEMEE